VNPSFTTNILSGWKKNPLGHNFQNQFTLGTYNSPEYWDKFFKKRGTKAFEWFVFLDMSIIKLIYMIRRRFMVSSNYVFIPDITIYNTKQ
jgi:hypothetical protein